MAISNLKKRFRLFIFIAGLFQALCYATQTQQNIPSSNNILIINSYTETSLWSNNFIDPIYKEYSAQKSRIDIYTEHMNMLAIDNEEALEQCKNNLFLKYEKTPPQLIILLGNSAWVLLNKDIEKNWRNIPVILCAEKEYIGSDTIYLSKKLIPKKDKKLLTDYQGDIPLTIFYAPFHIKQTIKLMKRLIPDMNKLVFLSDRRCISAQYRQDVNEVIQTEYPNIRIDHLIAGDITNDTLINSLKTFNSQTGILFFSWFKKEQQQGNSILTSNISRLLSFYSKAPIFTLHNDALQTNGLIGGCFWPNSIIKDNIIKIIKEELANPVNKGTRIIKMGTASPYIN